MKISPVVKISLSGLILALTIIFTRFLSIQNIPILPFVRISIGPALIVFASIFLGPIYGAVIGGASDILGILLVPNALGYAINPWFTLIYTLLGIVPWCFYKLFKLIKNEKVSLIVVIAFLLALWAFVLIYGLLAQDITGHTFELYIKIIIFAVSFVLIALTALAIILIKKHFEAEGTSVYNIALVVLLTETLVMLIGNSIVKSIFFEVDLLLIVFLQAIVFFIDIPLNTILVTYLMKLANRVFLKKNNVNYEEK